jgi:hypothetical protein
VATSGGTQGHGTLYMGHLGFDDLLAKAGHVELRKQRILPNLDCEFRIRDHKIRGVLYHTEFDFSLETHNSEQYSRMSKQNR